MTTPVIYLLVSIVGALLTVLALFPGPRKGALPSLFFASGMIVGEIAPWHVAWQVLATIAFAAAGAFETWPGWAGLAVSLASWGGLALAHARARRTPAAIEAALRETLGSDYRSAIAPEILAVVGEDRVARAWQVPFRRREPGVERIRNIVYGPAGDRNRLDVFRPIERAERCPTLVYIHGGAWVTGRHDDVQGLPLMLRLASLGWVCVKPGYRLGPHANFPDQLVDLKRALAWVREHGAEYGADPDFVIVTGGSAGGHLSALLALTANRPEYQPGFEHVDTSVTAAVPLYGAYDLLDRNRVRPDTSQMKFLSKRVLKCTPEENRALWDAFSPLSHVHPDAPPFFVVHGRHDSLLFFEDARHFVEALRKTSRQPVVYAELPHTQHGFELLHTVRASGIVDGVVRYLEYIRATLRGKATRQGERDATG
jgi:acetyl esterase/lipase